jgi:hypothetical protein
MLGRNGKDKVEEKKTGNEDVKETILDCFVPPQAVKIRFQFLWGQLEGTGVSDMWNSQRRRRTQRCGT